MSNNLDNQPPNFCGECGARLVPMATPYVERKCERCGKAMFGVEPGEDGTGIQIKKGDKFVIPAEALEFSLDPSKTTNRLFKPGIVWFMQQLYLGFLPPNAVLAPGSDTKEHVSEFIRKIEDYADNILENSPELSYADLENEDHAAAAIEHINEQKDSAEFWALMMGSINTVIKEACDNGDVGRAVLATAIVCNCRAMLIFKQHLEQHVWEGYQANVLAYKCATAAAQTPGEAKAIKTLEPIFEKLEEHTLHTWVSDGRLIGPRIGVTEIPDETLKALAQWHLNQREVNRKQRETEKEERRKLREEWWKGAGIAASVLGAIVAAVSKIVGLW